MGMEIDGFSGMSVDSKSQIAKSATHPGTEEISRRILTIRGQRVMLDADLAELYCVTTKRLNEQVKRNGKRFPEDFAFRLSAEEKTELVANCDWFKRLKHSTISPLAFTEHSAIMATSAEADGQADRILTVDGQDPVRNPVTLPAPASSPEA